MRREKRQKLQKRLSETERRKIARLCSQGTPASQVARTIGVTRNTAIKWRKRFGVAAWALPEKKVLRLLRAGWEQRRIARHLKVSFRRVSEFARKNGFARSQRAPLSQEEIRVIVGDIIHRAGSAAAIAKARRAPYKTVLALAHEWLACQRFLPVANPPLQSYFPSKPSPVPFAGKGVNQMQEHFVRLVEFYAGAYGGRIPADRAAFTAQILADLMPATSRRFGMFSTKEWEQEYERIGADLAVAVEAVATRCTAKFVN